MLADPNASRHRRIEFRVPLTEPQSHHVFPPQYDQPRFSRLKNRVLRKRLAATKMLRQSMQEQLQTKRFPMGTAESPAIKNKQKAPQTG